MATQTNNHFDTQSGIRERLALLAELGPALAASDWGYHPSRDYWYACGAERVRRTIEVKQEGVASLDIIAQRFGMDRRAAMAFIGYPESGRHLCELCGEPAGEGNALCPACAESR